MPPVRRVSANAIQALKDALLAAYWFKGDLYDYAKDAVGGEQTFLSGIEWRESYKRDSISTFVDRLVKYQDEHQDLLIGLLVDVAQMDSFPGLVRVEDAELKITAAREAVARLRAVVQPYEQALMEQHANQERFAAARTAAEDRRATAARIAELKAEYLEIMNLAPQQRGFALEKLLHDVFEAFDLDPHRSFRVVGEQIDGGFTLGGEHFLLEAKWQQPPVARDALDVFKVEIERRSENTLGLLVSINGFEPTAVSLHSGSHSPMILMDGGDLYAVLEARIDLRELLARKRRESSTSGRILITAAEILRGSG
jgi:Restriction endonuclease